MKIIGIGDNVTDIYVNQNKMYPGGQTLNFAVYAKMQGIESAYMGVFGNDYRGLFVRKQLSILNVDFSHSLIKEGGNGFAKIQLENGDRKFIGGNSGGISRINPLEIMENDYEYLKTFSLAHISLNSYVENQIPKIKELGLLISFDFSDRSTNEYIDSIIKNIDFAFFSVSNLAEDELKSKLSNVWNKNPTLVIGTLGAKGAVVYDGIKYYYHEAVSVQPIDTLGAGDSFQSSFIVNFLTKCKEFGINPTSKNYSLEKERAINQALDKASSFAAEICMLNGAFGMGEVIENR